MDANKRQIAHLKNVDRKEINECIDAVRNAFEGDWLAEKTASHPIRSLWKRQDAIATNELLNLGFALQEAERKQPGSGTSFARKIRKQDSNNQRGLLFELIVLGGLFAPHGSVLPTASNTPGYDLRVMFNDGGELLLSLKSWGTSHHERTLIKKATDFHDYVKSIALAASCYSINVRAVADRWPNEKSWDDLRSACQNAIRNQPLLRSNIDAGENWSVVIGPVWSPSGQLCTNRLSHELLAIIPYHGNEIRNFRSKVEEAIANAEKHASLMTNRMHGIIVRVPATLSWSDANDVVSGHFNDNPKGPVGIVLLLQTAVVTDKDNRSTQHFYLRPHIANAYPAWHSSAKSLGFRVMLGTVGSEASKKRIEMDDGCFIELDNVYTYHSGDLYVRFDGREVTMARLAPGLRQHAAMHIGGKEFVVKGKFPDNDGLVLFD